MFLQSSPAETATSFTSGSPCARSPWRADCSYGPSSRWPSILRSAGSLEAYRDKPSLRLINDQPEHGCGLCSRYRRRAVYEVARGLGAGVSPLATPPTTSARRFSQRALHRPVSSLPPVPCRGTKEFRLTARGVRVGGPHPALRGSPGRAAGPPGPLREPARRLARPPGAGLSAPQGDPAYALGSLQPQRLLLDSGTWTASEGYNRNGGSG